MTDTFFKANITTSAAAKEAQTASTPSATSANGMSVASQIPVSVKKVDFKDLKTGEDFRSQGAQPNPLAGNDTPVRAENNDSEGA